MNKFNRTTQANVALPKELASTTKVLKSHATDIIRFGLLI